MTALRFRTKKSNRTRQKKKRGDSKVESNDSPEIPGRVGDIRHPRPPFGGLAPGNGNSVSL